MSSLRIRTDAIGRNLRYGIRTLARAPGTSAAIVLTLALGIGASSAVFTAMDAVLFEPLPFPEPDRLVRVRQTRERAAVANVAPVRLEEWFEQSSSFEAIMGYTTSDLSDPTADPPERIRAAAVSPRMIEVFGIQPILGRGFVAADHEPGAAPVTVIGEGFWRRRFAADPSVIGTLVPDAQGAMTEIIGVMPASFAFPDADVDAWSAYVYSDFIMNRSNAWLTAYGRLKPDVTPEEAEADLDRVQSNLAVQFPETDRGLGADVESLKEMTVGEIRASLWLMFGAVFVLLVVACTNIAALLLARATERQHDVATRLALGASQRSITAQVLTEAGVLALIGAIIGLFFAEGAVRVFAALAPDFPRVADISLSQGTLLFTTAVVVGVTLLCGLAPVIANARYGNTWLLTEAQRGQISRRHSWQWLFVGSQVALSVALLSGAGLLIRSFQELADVDLGYDPDNVLTFRITGSFAEPVREPVERILIELPGLPGVEAVATSSPVPGVADDESGFQFGALNFQSIEGGSDSGAPIVAQNRVVSPSYFQTMEIPFLAGDACRFDGNDPVQEIVVNESFVRAYIPNRPPVGTLVRGSGENVFRIGAVVGDAREFGARRAPEPTVYRCFTVAAFPPLAFLVRTTGDPMSLVNTVRRSVAGVEPTRSIYDVRTLNERIGNEYAAERLRAVLIGAFAGAALTLVCLGIYGTLSYIVSLRRREIGLRVALGALRQTIVSHFMLKAFRVVGLAAAVGLVLAFLVSRGLASQLFGVSPTDPLTLAGVVVVILVVTGIGALLPSLSAARVDPMTALRQE